MNWNITQPPTDHDLYDPFLLDDLDLSGQADPWSVWSTPHVARWEAYNNLHDNGHTSRRWICDVQILPNIIITGRLGWIYTIFIVPDLSDLSVRRIYIYELLDSRLWLQTMKPFFCPTSSAHHQHTQCPSRCFVPTEMPGCPVSYNQVCVATDKGTHDTAHSPRR